MRIGIDKGHTLSGSDTGARGFVIEENRTRAIGNKVIQYLKQAGHYIDDLTVDYATSVSESLNTRVNDANDEPLDLVVSIHLNAGGGKGVEIYTYNGEKYDYATRVLNNIVGLGFVNRGIKDGSDFAMVGRTTPTAMLVECCFVDTQSDAEKIDEDHEVDAMALAIASGIDPSIKGGKVETVTVEAEKANSKPASGKYMILDTKSPSTSVAQMKQWAKNKGANQIFIDLAETFYKVAIKLGINPALLYAQSAKETGYMNFGAVLDASYKNPCGLKISAGGGDTDANAHMRFDTWEQGITAMAEHLALYAGKDGYPLKNPTDPRHFAWILGTAKSVSDLNDKWATPTSGEKYGDAVVRLMNELVNTSYDNKLDQEIKEEIKEEKENDDMMMSLEDQNHWGFAVMQELNAEGLDISEARFNDTMTRAEGMALAQKVLKRTKQLIELAKKDIIAELQVSEVTTETNKVVKKTVKKK